MNEETAAPIYGWTEPLLTLIFGLTHLEFRTLTCMAGGIAQTYHGTIPDYTIKEVKSRLDENLLKERGADDVMVIGGGIIPEEDVPKPKKLGIKEIFLPGTSLDKIVG